MRRVLPLLLLLAALFAASCGEERTAEESRPAESAEAAGEEAAGAAGSAEGLSAAAISKELTEKPAVPKPSGEAPAELVAEDVVEGDGPAAKAGDQLTVQYVGVSWSTGEQFDASWDNGQPFPFTLGQGQVIPGWDQGLEGMKQGGRRLLVIPPDLAYGPQGSGPIGPNETLVFVVDLVRVGGS